jgi:hypothetical protein
VSRAPLGTRALLVVSRIRAAGIGERCVDRQVVPVFAGVNDDPAVEIRDAIVDDPLLSGYRF